MKSIYFLMVFLISVVLFGCASKQVLVDLDSCEDHGTIKGTHIAECKKVELK